MILNTIPLFNIPFFALQLAINRVDPFNNHSCWDEDNKEEWSIYDRFKGSVYSVQVRSSGHMH